MMEVNLRQSWSCVYQYRRLRGGRQQSCATEMLARKPLSPERTGPGVLRREGGTIRAATDSGTWYMYLVESILQRLFVDIVVADTVPCQSSMGGRRRIRRWWLIWCRHLWRIFGQGSREGQRDTKIVSLIQLVNTSLNDNNYTWLFVLEIMAQGVTERHLEISTRVLW